MLRSLIIHDFVLIPRLELHFGPGLTVVTGETGAGKSVLLAAARLLLGGRADPDLVRAGADKAVLEALFDVPPDHPVRGMLEARGYEADDELLVRRVVPAKPGGRGQILLNGRLATAAILREVAGPLVGVSSQHEQRTLSDPATHLDLLDAFAGTSAERAAVGEAYRALSAALRRREDLLGEHARRVERAEFLRHRAKALAEAGLRPGEVAELEADVAARKGGAKLAGAIERAAGALHEGEDGTAATAMLARAEAAAREAARIDPRLERLGDQIAEARAVAEDAGRELSAYRDRIDFDPARLEAMEDRLHRLRALLRDHGGTEEAALERLAAMRAELDLVDRHEDHRAAVDREVAEAESALDGAARRLSQARGRAARRLGKEISAALGRLGMEGALVEVGLSPPEEGIEVNGRRIGPAGAEIAEFRFAPNPGEGVHPLARIASGGELSRLLLAVKRVLADREPVTTYLFDEVDAGVSGEAARRLASAVADVARHHQVICVTHLPAVASLPGGHVEVEKAEEGGRTVTRARPLDGRARVEAVARLLGGSDPGPKARAAAADLLRRAGTES